MKSAALTLVVTLSLSASAFAQQDVRTDRDYHNERVYRNDYDQLIIGLRNTLPTGEALPNVRWGDLISGGIGLELQYQQLYRANSWIYGGWYARLAIDSFGGRTFTEGDEFRTDRLNTAGLEFGGRLRQNFSGFFLDENVGVGALAYMKQDIADRTLGVDKLEFIKTTVTYMIDVGARVGAPLGKDVELSLGVAFQYNGAPSEGKDFSGLNFKPMQNIVLGLTLDIGF